VFGAVVLLTLVCLSLSYFSCRDGTARTALNDTLLTTVKLGFGAIIALLGRYSK
jgi:hypothetical protein